MFQLRSGNEFRNTVIRKWNVIIRQKNEKKKSREMKKEPANTEFE